MGSTSLGAYPTSDQNTLKNSESSKSKIGLPCSVNYLHLHAIYNYLHRIYIFISYYKWSQDDLNCAEGHDKDFCKYYAFLYKRP